MFLGCTCDRKPTFECCCSILCNHVENLLSCHGVLFCCPCVLFSVTSFCFFPCVNSDFLLRGSALSLSLSLSLPKTQYCTNVLDTSCMKKDDNASRVPHRHSTKLPQTNKRDSLAMLFMIYVKNNVWQFAVATKSLTFLWLFMLRSALCY